MSTRATADDVKAIMEFDPSITDLSPFIAAANELVTEICVPAGYTEARLTMIETWLAGHFLAVRDPRYQSEGMGSANASYQGQTTMNLSLTTYGQQAQLLDTAGGLARLDKHVTQGKRAVAGIVYLGTQKDPQSGGPSRWLYQDLAGLGITL